MRRSASRPGAADIFESPDMQTRSRRTGPYRISLLITMLTAAQASAQTINTIGETDSNNLGWGYQVSTTWSMFQTFRTPSGYAVLTTLRFPAAGTAASGTVSVREFTGGTFLSSVYSSSIGVNGSTTVLLQPKVSLDPTKTYALYWTTSSGSYTLNDVYRPSSYYYADGQSGYVSGGSVSYISDASFEFYMAFGTAGPDSANTLTALKSSAAAVRNRLVAGEAVLASTLAYDSNAFGEGDVSLSFIGRYTALSDSSGEGAGALVAAYRLQPNLRLGAFFDYAPGRDAPTGTALSETEPSLGVFGVYEQNKDLTGLNIRLAGAYGHGRLTVTRDASLADTEAGSGKAGTNAFAVSAEAGFGLRIAPTIVAVPYVGLRRTDVTRKGYTEGTTTDVSAPLTYDDYGLRLTTALGGVRFHGRLDEKIAAVVGLGAEYDVGRKMDAYAGTSSISGLETFSIATNSHANRLRPSAVAGVAYEFAANRTLSAQIAVRGQAYSADPSLTSTVKYSVGF